MGLIRRTGSAGMVYSPPAVVRKRKGSSKGVRDVLHFIASATADKVAERICVATSVIIAMPSVLMPVAIPHRDLQQLETNQLLTGRRDDQLTVDASESVTSLSNMIRTPRVPYYGA